MIKDLVCRDEGGTQRGEMIKTNNLPFASKILRMSLPRKTTTKWKEALPKYLPCVDIF